MQLSLEDVIAHAALFAIFALFAVQLFAASRFLESYDCAMLCGLDRSSHGDRLSYVMITMSAVCMWMLWGMAWLMQWHPLIYPIREIEHSA